VTRLASPGRIAAARRTNYERIDANLRGLAGGRALYPRLPDGACPWVFPFLADDPEALCERLRQAGVPVVRFGLPLWQGVDHRVCATSARLSRHVVGFACHQELQEHEMAWMIETIRKALA